MKQTIKLFSICLFLTISLINVQAFQGMFKKNSLVKKSLKISSMSGQFLKHILFLQQNFLKNRMNCHKTSASCLPLIQTSMQVNETILQNNEIHSKDVDQLFESAAKASKILCTQECKTSCELQTQTWHGWWLYLQQSLKQAKLLGLESDRAWLGQQIADFDNKMQTDDQRSIILMRCAKVFSQMMHQFEGVLVTEYDLLVLANMMIALVALQC